MKTIHLLCNAHLDPVWLWEWEEGAAAAISTFRVAADLCEDYNTFVFNHNEAVLYQWIEEYEPVLFERIQRLVKAGQWHIMGGWYLQPDCNLPSGESFVRQILTGRRYFQEEFGARPTTAINFDPFGHTQGLVQILAKSGYDSYLFCRPDSGSCTLPNDDFTWVGYDGSTITGHRAMNWYNSSLGKAREKAEGWMVEQPDREVSLLFWGVGDHGGGPSRKDVADLEALIAETSDFEIRHSTPEAYFAAIRDAGMPIPRHETDINPWAVGCYTSQVRIKQGHRRLENALYAMEKMAANAALLGVLAYPADDLAEAQRDLLFTEFHDILPGSSIQPVEEMSVRMQDHGLEILSRLKARTFFAMAQGQPVAAEGEIPILVYNPHPFPVCTTVECEFQLADQNRENTFTDITVTQNGKALPTQVEKELSNLNMDWRKRVAFDAVLAPSQMNRYDCKLNVIPEKPEPQAEQSGHHLQFNNGEMEVLINTRTGCLDRYRVHGVDMLREGAVKFLVIKDNEDPWGMTVNSFRDVVGAFRLMSPEEGTAFSGVHQQLLPSVRVVEQGDVRTVVEVVLEYNHSAVCLRYILPQRGTEVGLDVRVIWNEKDRMLKLSLPTTLGDSTYVGQVAFGVSDLPSDGKEAVAQQWTAAVTDELAVSLINDSTYGSDFSEGEIRMSLLRSSAYSGHPIGDRVIVPQDRFTARIDQGERLFRFWLNAGVKDERLVTIDREALVHNQEPFALSFFPHGGGEAPLPGVTLDDDVVLMSAFKQTENGDGYLIRLFEPTGKARKTTLNIPAASVSEDVTLGGFEVKSFVWNPSSRTLTEVNMIEEVL